MIIHLPKIGMKSKIESVSAFRELLQDNLQVYIDHALIMNDNVGYFEQLG